MFILGYIDVVELSKVGQRVHIKCGHRQYYVLLIFYVDYENFSNE